MTANKVTTDRFRISSIWKTRLPEHHISVSAVLRRAGLPAGFFQQEKIYVTTAEFFQTPRGRTGRIGSLNLC